MYELLMYKSHLNSKMGSEFVLEYSWGHILTLLPNNLFLFSSFFCFCYAQKSKTNNIHVFFYYTRSHEMPRQVKTIVLHIEGYSTLWIFYPTCIHNGWLHMNSKEKWGILCLECLEAINLISKKPVHFLFFLFNEATFVRNMRLEDEQQSGECGLFQKTAKFLSTGAQHIFLS